MTDPQAQPAHKDAWTREVERLEEMDRRRWARANGEREPEVILPSLQALVDRAVGPARPEPKPWRDPRISVSGHVLANRALGRADDFGDDTANGTDDQ